MTYRMVVANGRKNGRILSVTTHMVNVQYVTRRARQLREAGYNVIVTTDRSNGRELGI